jgi:hypothetical protein
MHIEQSGFEHRLRHLAIPAATPNMIAIGTVLQDRAYRQQTRRLAHLLIQTQSLQCQQLACHNFGEMITKINASVFGHPVVEIHIGEW